MTEASGIFPQGLDLGFIPQTPWCVHTSPLQVSSKAVDPLELELHAVASESCPVGDGNIGAHIHNYWNSHIPGQPWTHDVANYDLEVLTLTLSPPKWWDCRHAPSRPFPYYWRSSPGFHTRFLDKHSTNWNTRPAPKIALHVLSLTSMTCSWESIWFWRSVWAWGLNGHTWAFAFPSVCFYHFPVTS